MHLQRETFKPKETHILTLGMRLRATSTLVLGSRIQFTSFLVTDVASETKNFLWRF